MKRKRTESMAMAAAKCKGTNVGKHSTLAAMAQRKSAVPSIREKGKLDRAVISKIYDDPILHILAHRGDDEEAMSYVENFVQYRHSASPLMIDLSDITNTLRIIVHEGL